MLKSMVSCLLMMAGLCAAAFPNSGQAFSYWPDTGQATCYDAAGTVITCPSEGQPFHGQDAQYPGAGRSYTDLGGGTIKDNVTGLEWQKATAPGTYTWQAALAYCEGLTLNGQSDWRLPTIKELATLADLGRSNPAIDPVFAATTQSSDYWSSTTVVYITYVGVAWLVNFNVGHIIYYNKSSSPCFVRAVRGGQ